MHVHMQVCTLSIRKQTHVRFITKHLTFILPQYLGSDRVLNAASWVWLMNSGWSWKAILHIFSSLWACCDPALLWGMRRAAWLAAFSRTCMNDNISDCTLSSPASPLIFWEQIKGEEFSQNFYFVSKDQQKYLSAHQEDKNLSFLSLQETEAVLFHAADM